MTLSDGSVHGFENGLNSFARFMYNMNRLLTPLHSLKSEEEVNEFFGNSTAVFSKEMMTPLFKKSKEQHQLRNDYRQEFEQVVA